MTATGNSGDNLYRKQEIAKIQIGKGKLGLDDDDYRDLLDRLTGMRSTRDMSRRQRAQVLAYMEQHGAYADQPKKRISRDPQARMIHALWAELGRTGSLDKPGKDGLRAFIASQLYPDQAGVAVDPDHLTIHQGRDIIEALKSWLKRVSK